MDTTPRILVVDDDQNIREPLCAHIKRNGFECIEAGDAQAARDLLKSRSVDLVVLDVMMPGEDGLSLCRHIRATMSASIILLTALADDTDRIIGLEIGADDYVTKPFNPRELIARIRAVLRRTTTREKAGIRDFREWRLDAVQSELHRKDGLVVPLSTGEVAILKALLDRPGEVMSRNDLMATTRGRETLPFERSIDNLISRLRRKIEKDPKNPRIIKTVWGGGYRIVTDAESE